MWEVPFYMYCKNSMNPDQLAAFWIYTVFFFLKNAKNNTHSALFSNNKIIINCVL